MNDDDLIRRFDAVQAAAYAESYSEAVDAIRAIPAAHAADLARLRAALRLIRDGGQVSHESAEAHAEWAQDVAHKALEAK